MPTVTLSRKVVAALPAKLSAYIAYDNRLPGFGCRVTPRGAKSWIVEFRPHGGGRRVAKKRLTLGHISTVTPEAARRAAAEVLAHVQLGADVAEERATLRMAPTIAELVERFMAEEIRPTRKRSTSTHYDMLFRKHILPEFGNVRACALTRSQVARFHRAVGADRAVTANRLVTLISGLYSWAIKAGEVPEDVRPARGVTKFREEGRERFLSMEELGRLGDALREAETVGIPWEIDANRPTAKHAPKPENRRCKISPSATAAIRLLLLTGCRLREILHLRWEYVDFERGMLFLPDSKTGRKPVMLSSAALSLLDAMPRVGKYVVIGANLDGPRHDLQRPWSAIARRAGLEGVRLHDLRHSFAATGAGNGLGLLVIGKLLGHRNFETTSRYAHLDCNPLRMAANQIANQLATAIGQINSQTALPAPRSSAKTNLTLDETTGTTPLPSTRLGVD